MTPSNPETARYSLTELADLAGVTPRTVRYYLAQGLLPAVGVAGPGAKYDDSHLARLRLIKRLQHEHLPLAEIRTRLDDLTESDILALAERAPEPATDSALDYIRRVTSTAPPSRRAVPPPPAAAAAPAAPPVSHLLRAMSPMASPAPTAPADPAPDLPTQAPTRTTRATRSQWERIGLDADVELHIRRPLSRPTAKRVDRLIEIARDLFEEDKP
jgi:DNA-binding transcriptional MerR regulator